MAKIKSEKSLWIRQDGGNVQGPFPVSRIRGWINKGKVRPEMNFSLDGDHWVPGDAVPGLFEPVIELAESETRSRGMLWAVCVAAALGLVGSFDAFLVTGTGRNAFLGLQGGARIWSNLYGIGAMTLFVALLVAAAYHWRSWGASSERTIGCLGIGMGAIQLVAFVVAALLQTGWIGAAGSYAEASNDRDRVAESMNPLHDLIVQGQSAKEAREFRESMRRLDEVASSLTPPSRPGLAFYWLVACSLGVLAGGVGMVRRTP